MNHSNSRNQLVQIIEKADQEQILSREEIIFLLGLRQDRQINTVFQAARRLRRRYFGDRVFLYGFIYISTFCHNNCSFCYYRCTNLQPARYRQKLSDILAAARRLADSGVHLIDLTLGEDPFYFLDGQRGSNGLIQTVKAVRRETGLPVMVSPGAVPDDILAELAGAGADWFACYQETHNPVLFEKLRTGQSYPARMAKKQLARRLGMLIEEGVLCGVGESAEDMAESLDAMRCLGASQMRAMSLVPQKGTPMQDMAAPDALRERLTIAVLRFCFPDRLIPASLDVAGLDGLPSRLAAGANVVTSLVPPGFGLAGVAQNSLDIAEARRSAASIRPQLEKLGMRAAAAEDYQIWVADRRRKMLCNPVKENLAC
jgi:methylornithine synthase